MNFVDRVGLAVRRRRLVLNLSQDDVVARMEMSRGHYSDIENGKRNIGLTTLHRIAEALETEAWKILKEASSR